MMIGKEGFDMSQPIRIIPLLTDFRISCNNADIREGAVVWLLTYFVRVTFKSSYKHT